MHHRTRLYSFLRKYADHKNSKECQDQIRCGRRYICVYGWTFHTRAKHLILLMLRLLLFKAHGLNILWKTSKQFHVGIHWIPLAEYSQMSNPCARVCSFYKVFYLHHLVLAELATSSIRVKRCVIILNHFHVEYAQCVTTSSITQQIE